MESEEARRKLELFEIPSGGGEEAEKVRGILAPLLSFGAVSLGELQTARDIAERKRDVADAVYVFLAAMFVSLRDGNAVFNLKNGTNENGKLLSDACRRNAPEQEFAAADELEGKIKTVWPAAVAAAESIKGDIVGECDAGIWCFSRQKEALDGISGEIRSRFAETGESLTEDELESATGYKGEGGSGFSLGEEQRSAVKATVRHMLTVITGGPGTGKTTIICSILRALMKKAGLKSGDIALVAPTGRAAQRMGEALHAQCAMADASQDEKDAIGGLEGVTVHSLLGGYGPKWRYNEDNPLPHRLVVVDESSMVDLILMRSLLAALRKDCRLVLLGDKNQLPSVDAGAVFGDLIEIGGNGGNNTAFIELTESRRFKGRLKECAEEFNKGEIVSVRSSRLPRSGNESWTDVLEMKDAENGCFWYELPSDCGSAKIDGLLKDWSGRFGLLKDGALAVAAKAAAADDGIFDGGCCSDAVRNLFGILDRSRILSVVRKGPFGAEHINDLLLKERLGRFSAEPLVDGGIPVIITRNTRSMNLFNGDVGVTVKRAGRGVYALFPRGEKVVSCPVSLLPDHDLAYAMTVHKSQGSEFENVLMVLPDDRNHPLLNRQIVYTGITRAKRRAVIAGSEKALTAAISRKIERDTGLSVCGG